VAVLGRPSLVLAIALLSACTDAAPSQEASADYRGIIQAALLKQPDMAAQRRAFVNEYPDESSVFDKVFDYRLCVSPESAGQSGDFVRSKHESNDAPPDLSIYRTRWERSATRQSIPAELLPKHLRWDSASSICPSGTLRIGNPIINGTDALVYVENASTVHGWGGELKLTKIGDRWVVLEEKNWWQA